jgi:hypothetical protein
VSGAVGNGLGTMIKYLRHTTSGARTLLPAALASVPFLFVLVRVRVLRRGQRPEPTPGITDVLIQHTRTAIAFFCAFIRRQQADLHFRGPGFR